MGNSLLYPEMFKKQAVTIELYRMGFEAEILKMNISKRGQIKPKLCAWPGNIRGK